MGSREEPWAIARTFRNGARELVDFPGINWTAVAEAHDHALVLREKWLSIVGR